MPASNGEATEVFACVIGEKTVPTARMYHLSNDATPIVCTYPFWVLRRGDLVTLVDTGFARETAERRGVTYYADPLDRLGALGIDPEAVGDIVITHAHFDHLGALDPYRNAIVHIQAAELEYFTGRGAHHPYAEVAERPALEQLDRLRAEGRLDELDGAAEIELARLVPVGGHTPGMQVAAVRHRPAPLVLAADASHYFMNLEHNTPTTLIHAYEPYQSGFDVIRALSAGGNWLPGHDPKMLDLLDPVADGVYRVPLEWRTPSGASQHPNGAA